MPLVHETSTIRWLHIFSFKLILHSTTCINWFLITFYTQVHSVGLILISLTDQFHCDELNFPRLSEIVPCEVLIYLLCSILVKLWVVTSIKGGDIDLDALQIWVLGFCSFRFWYCVKGPRSSHSLRFRSRSSRLLWFSRRVSTFSNLSRVRFMASWVGSLFGSWLLAWQQVSWQIFWDP